MPSLAILFSAVLVLSCGHTDRITEAILTRLPKVKVATRWIVIKARFPIAELTYDRSPLPVHQHGPSAQPVNSASGNWVPVNTARVEG